MNVDIDVEIERIENGFIITNGENRKQYYSSMREFCNYHICEIIDKADKDFREHDSYGEKIRLIFAMRDTAE